MKDYDDILELKAPHGFLMAQGKKTAIVNGELLDYEKSYLIVSNGEAFGVAQFEQPAQVKVKEFDAEEWQELHRVTPRERRQWWPDMESFYVYRIKDWQPFEGIKLYEDGQVKDEPRLTAQQWQIVSAAKDLPKQIMLIDDVVSITENKEFAIDIAVSGSDELKDVLIAAYQTEIKEAAIDSEAIPLYSLALVRNPRMRVSKKNLSLEGIGTKQEGETMPYRIRERDGEYCVIKVNPDDSDGEVEKCHPDMEMAQAHLAALNINVVAEEESNAKSDKETTDQKTEETQKQFDNSEWSGAAANWPDTDAYCSDCLIDVNPSGEDKIQGLCKLPYRKLGASNPNLAALQNIGARFDQLEKPGDVSGDAWNSALRSAANKLISWWPEAFDTDAPEAIYQAAGKTRPKAKKGQIMGRLKSLAKSLYEAITLAETEEKEVNVNILNSNYGVAQKEVNGELWHFTWSTNAFMDREGEIFSTKSLENYVSEAEKKADRGYFNLWHINAEDGNFNTDFARKEWQGVMGRFLVEAGPYLDTPKGQAAKEFFSKFPGGHPEIAPEGWGCSPEFRYLPEERAKGIYENIWITRTSTLPKFAAANVWTDTRQLARSKDMALSEDQMKAAIAAFGKDEIDNLLTEAEKRTAELEAANVAHKEIKDAPQPEPQKINIEDLAAEVGKQLSVNFEPVAEAITTMTSGLEAAMKRIEALEKGQTVKDKTEAPRFVFEWKRASESADTIVTEDDGLKGKKPAENQGASSDPWSQVFNK